MENLTVTIPDINLANAIRDAIGLSFEESIPQKELKELEELNAEEKEIEDITGLESASGLKVLELQKTELVI